MLPDVSLTTSDGLSKRAEAPVPSVYPNPPRTPEKSDKLPEKVDDAEELLALLDVDELAILLDTDELVSLLATLLELEATMELLLEASELEDDDVLPVPVIAVVSLPEPDCARALALTSVKGRTVKA